MICHAINIFILVSKLDQGTQLCWTLLEFFWSNLDHIEPNWTNLYHSVYLDPYIWTRLFGPRLFGPVYLDPSIFTCLYGPVYLVPFYWDLSLLTTSIQTRLVGSIYVDQTIDTFIFRPVYLALSIWTCLFTPILDLSVWTRLYNPSSQSRLIGPV